MLSESESLPLGPLDWQDGGPSFTTKLIWRASMADPGNVHTSIAGVLRNRIMVAYALCAVAESQVHTAAMQNAVGTVKSIRALISEVALLLADPDRLSASALREAAELFAELESRVQAIEDAMSHQSPQ